MDFAKRILMVFLCYAAAFVATADGPAASAEKPAAPSIPWKLPSYTLVARDMDLRVALETFAVAEGLSVVMSPSVLGRFSGDFKDVPPGNPQPDVVLRRRCTIYLRGGRDSDDAC